jgi:hypothetical protein
MAMLKAHPKTVRPEETASATPCGCHVSAAAKWTIVPHFHRVLIQASDQAVRTGRRVGPGARMDGSEEKPNTPLDGLSGFTYSPALVRKLS